MRFNLRPAVWFALAAFLATVHALSPVTRSGRYLYTSDGNRFYIKGVAYQQQGSESSSSGGPFSEPTTFTDPLADGNGCTRDLPFLKALNVNAIRAYSVNSGLNHDVCMNLFSSAGIYAIIDLTLPVNGSIDRNSPSWSTNLLDQYINTINVFKKYDNVLAYNVGNEVVTSDLTYIAPYVKAAARDTKAYLQSISSTALVGYSDIDGPSSFRQSLAEYLSCDPSGANSDVTSIDLFGLNNYEWCGDDSISAYSGVNNDFADYNVAAYFSEYGCITNPPRLWTEVAALFSNQMASTWSGGVAFSYFPAQSDQGQFGMVTLSSDGSTVTTGDDYARLQQQYGNVTFINSPSQAAAGASTYPSCPTTTDTWLASTSLPPTPNEAACDCLENNLSCRFTPVTADYNTIVGQLIDNACSFLGSKGANCDDIGGGNGTYGRLSGCDPTIKLSYLMSEWYELNNKDVQACSFAGNGTVNQNAVATTSAAIAAATSCLANPSATFLPPAPSTTVTGTAGSPGKNGALADKNVVVSAIVFTCAAALGAILTLS